MSIYAYLRFVLAPKADAAAFEADLARVRALAAAQPGHRRSEVARGLEGGRTYLVVSEWDDVESLRAFEHHPEHEAIMARWESSYAEALTHRRLVPWRRPEGT